MNTPNHQPTGEQPPAAVQWAVNVHRTARLRQDKIQSDITAMDAKLAELAKYADEIRANRDAAADELAKVTMDADVALEMAMAACRSHGWELPEPEGEPPLNETGQFEAVQPGDATQVIPAAYPTTWEYDGTVWELRAQLVDRAGEVWEWTGEFAVHRPLYQCDGGDPLTLPELIEFHGPVFYRKPAQPADAATEVIDRVAATPAAEGGERQ